MQTPHRASLELSDGATFDGLDTDGMRSNNHEYVFTEWVKGSSDDLDAVRRAFDSNGDGKLTNADVRWGAGKLTKRRCEQKLAWLLDRAVVREPLARQQHEISLLMAHT